MTEIPLHPMYLPFTEGQLRSHFADIRQKGWCIGTADKHIKHYKRSIENYEKYLEHTPNRKGKPISDLKVPCQIEKDEKFWTASCLMTIFHTKERGQQLRRLFQSAYGASPPFLGIKSWQDCFKGKLYLFFEVNLPSPKSYKAWLRQNLFKQQFIPYILDSDHGRKNLEGPTNADALLLNPDNGFSAIIEAKVLSDISYQITYDVMRNQIARNIDVMLEENSDLCPPLDTRDPSRTLFLLITPRVFKQKPWSRLYGYKFKDYQTDPVCLGTDLPHRENYDWKDISRRLGWLTWQDFKDANKDCCRWLD